MALQIPKWVRRYLRWKDPFRKGTQEAADQYLGKAGKLQTFNDMIFAADLDELADDDREAVAQFREKKMGITRGDGGNKDRIVCDDMTINSGGNGVLAMVLGALLALVAAWFFLGKAETPAAAADQVATTDLPDSEYEVRFYDKDGNQITVPRRPTSSP